VADAELARLRRDYRALQDQIRGLGFVAPGSVIERYTVCGTHGCRCHRDPPTRHGPYFQYTRKLDGKTLTRRLNAEQADRYREWIANRRRLDELTDQMDQLSHQATELLLAQPTSAKRQRAPHNRPAQVGAHIASEKCGT
jgi:hypothetical protein